MTAQATPMVGELVERRTQNSQTRRNEDGSLTTTVFAGPVNYRAADGSMQPIDTRLNRIGDAGYAWRSGANAFEARFASASSGEYMEVRVGERRFRMAAIGAARQPAQVAGSQLTYRGAFAGVDLRYEIAATGVKETLVLSGPDAPTRYTFRLSPADGGAGLTAQRRADGSVAVNAAPLPGPAFVLAAPTVTESAGGQQVMPPDPAAQPALEVTEQGRNLLVTLSLDAGWLHAPERRFPIELDPTISIQPDVEDANFTPLSNYVPFVHNRLYIGSGDTYTWRPALQFDLSALPVDAQVTAASLGIYFDGWCISATGVPHCGGTSHSMDVHRLTTPWTTSTTFGQLGIDPAIVGSYTLPSSLPQGWMGWPVTSLVSGWVTGATPNYGLMIQRHTEVAKSSGPASPGRRYTEAPSLQPKLEITYTSDAVDLLEPATLHSNGAELAWTRYSGPSGEPFDRYEVHRSTEANFTPSPSTLLATIRDPAITTWRDITAAPNKTFTYRVVANGSASNPRTVTLPGAGLARKTLQPGPADGTNTYLYYSTQITNCANYGAGTLAWVGTSSNAKWRDVVSFNLRDIPANATIGSAKLSLWRQYGSSVAMTIEARRVTRAWKEGTGSSPPTCTGDGATWYETEGGQSWTSPGGDIDSTVAGSASVAADTSAAWDTFTLTGLVQSWVNGSKPNHGVLLKAGNEGLLAGNSVVYVTDDYTASPTLRPKLTVDYADGSVSHGPTVSVAAPGPGATVSGSGVHLAAAASDDSRVTQVEFRIDGSPVGTDTSAPYEMDWDSASVSNGTYSVTARATDDAGNATTSTQVSITVDNTDPPTGALTAPANNATVSGQVTVSADASDDVGVARVEFLVDGVRVGAPDTTAPYSITWNTLDPLARIFNGAHQLSAVVTDTSGQQVTTPARTVTVDNLGTSPHGAGFTLNAGTGAENVFPPTMAENTRPGVPVQDPSAGEPNPDGTRGGSLERALGDPPHDDAGPPPGSCPADAYCPTVTVQNNSGTTWQNSPAQVWYRWYAPNGAIMFEGRSSAAFPDRFGRNATQAFPLTIYPPALPAGAAQGTYRLRIDIYDPATGTWFAARGNPPMDNAIIVGKSLATKLGVERYYQYDAAELGAGMSSLTNVANGDMLLRWSPFFAPGRGLSTMVDLTYNSLEDHSKSPAGNNFSLSVSGLIRFGEPLDIHPNKADEISGRSNKWVEFTDGDGTTHRFTDGVTGGDGITRFTEPSGVNLYLRSVPTNPDSRRWALTRPDKVTFYYDTDGYPTAVEDRNGNTLTFTLEDTPPGEDPGGPKRRITAVTDAGGRSFTIDYWSKAEAKKAHVRGNIQTITDHDGSALDFDYYDDGNLLRITQRGGTTAGGEFLADRSFVFTYTTSSGSGPAIPELAAREDPDPKTANQSTRIYSVRDPRGAETTYAYYGPAEGPQLRWKLQSRTTRDGQTTSYGYDLTTRVTTITAPLNRVTRYTYDTSGKITQIVNPKLEPTTVEWTSDFKVEKVIEPTGKFTTYTYNANGYLTSQTNQLGEKTELTYTPLPVDPGDTGNHLSLLATVTNPKGVATPGDPTDYRWTFTYDNDGNPDLVTDPTGAVTNYDFNPAGTPDAGTLLRIHDANDNPPTVFEAYDPSGQPTQIRDPLGNPTRFGYDPDGRLTYIQDPNHQNITGADVRAYRSYFDYDSFGRLGRQSAPKSTHAARGALIWSSADFDPNDNIARTVDPHDGPATGDPGGGFATTTSYDAMDRPRLTTGPDTSTDPAGERTLRDYDAAGRLVKITEPRGMATGTVDDFTTVVAYDPLDRVIRQTENGTSTTDTRVTHSCFDLAGDLISVTAPNAALATLTCPAADTTRFTTRYTYDPAHRLVAQRDPLGHQTRATYDKNGNITTTERDIDTAPTPDRIQKTTTSYDQRDMPIEVRDRFTATRDTVTKIEYDRNGNQSRIVSPRAYDAAAGSGTYTSYVTSYDYDPLNRLVRTTLPFDFRDGTERQHVHRAYDANGNSAWTSLPVTSASPTSVADTARTVLTYYDPGWIRTSDDPVLPRVRFDYTARGQQATRVPELPGQPGVPDNDKLMSWEYYPDGMLKARTDQGGQSSTYRYDPNNNLTNATDAAGIIDPTQKPVDTQATYTGFDQPAKIRHRPAGGTAWTFSDYTYDRNGNTTQRRENGQETDAGSQTVAPRLYQFSYDDADWLTEQLDHGTSSACQNDQRIVTTFWGTGWEKQREIYRAGSSCVSTPTTWPKKQTTTWTHFDNGKLDQLTTKNGAGTTTESHDVGYTDSAGTYLNGHQASDRYTLTRAAGNTATTCLTSSPCDAVYTYDARDRLLSHQRRAGVTTSYALDQPAQLLGDTTIRAGNVTSQTRNGVTTTRKYQANQLTQATTSGVTVKYWYDPLGNLDCATTSTGTQANCSPSDGGTPANLISDYAYDYLNRLTTARQYSGGATLTDRADYTYDALDRVVKEAENHAGTGNDRTTAFTYQGLTNLVTQELQTGGTNPKTKTYAYDAYGHRISLTDKNNATGVTDPPYTYGHDVHGSISQLLTDSGAVKASYGYDAYGGTDAPSSDTQALTTGDTNAQVPLNPYRYTGKRLDSGLATGAGSPAGYDMGARRYGPDTSRFLQHDIFNGALANLGLSLDPLTQNPYALAGGNPISYIEWDGHVVTANGGGGAAPAPTPSTPPPSEPAAGSAPDEPSTAQRFVSNLTGFFGGAKDGAADAFTGATQLGYDFFVGSSPFVSEQTRQETKARAQARGELLTHPSQLVAAVSQPYREDIAAGDDARAAGRAVFDIGTLLLGGTAALGKTGKLTTAAKSTTTFRGDFRAPADIFREGFQPVGKDLDLLRHAEGTSIGGSGYVATSKSASVAEGFGPNVYTIRGSGGVDVNATLGTRSPYPHELEIAYPGGVSSSCIVGCTLPGGMWVPNSGFVP